MNKAILIGISLLIGIYIISRLFFNSNNSQSNSNELDDIIHSDKYKVKGRFDENKF